MRSRSASDLRARGLTVIFDDDTARELGITSAHRAEGRARAPMPIC